MFFGQIKKFIHLIKPFIIKINIIVFSFSIMSLKDKICLVTGASRGIGRGIALALGNEGATVYITGRTLHKSDNVTGSLSATADEVSARGGQAFPVQCDHGVDNEIDQLFQTIARDHGKIDLLVNNAFKGNNIII